jgi:uncharacterized protein DUF2442
VSISRVDIEVPQAVDVLVDDDAITVDLSDARSITVPLAWYPRLLHGSQEERHNWRLIGDGEGIHWEDLDEDISVENLLTGRRSGESPKSFKKWLAARARP